MHVGKITGLVLLLKVLAMPGSLIGQPAVDTRAVDEAVAAAMQDQELVGAAVGVILDGQVVYLQGYGMADLRREIPVTTETVFNWASNSKPLIAVAALQLVEQGKLDLDQPIARYLPDLPESLHAITTRQLLCHQSGIPHYRNGPVIPAADMDPGPAEQDPRVAIRRFLHSPLVHEPGAQMSYSSHAYVLLTAVVQAAGGQPIADQIQQRIAGPLNMSSFQLDQPRNDQPHWTRAYRRSAAGKPRLVPDVSHGWKHGAGGYKTNIGDFATWARSLINQELLSPEMSRQMWTDQETSDGQSSGYGLGVGVAGRGDGLRVSHSGGQDETRTWMILHPQQKRGVVVLCNTAHANPAQLARAITAALAADE